MTKASTSLTTGWQESGGSEKGAYVAPILGTFVFLSIPGIGLEMVQIGREYRVPPRHVVATAVLGVFGGIVIGGVIYLATLYGRGVENFESLGTFDPETQIGEFDSWHNTATERYLKGESLVAWSDFSNPTGIAMAFAAAGTALVAVLRQFFAGFWFHPIGFILGPSEMMEIIWGSIFAAWMIRFAVLKIGGATTVRAQLYPFATGIFLGSALSNAIFLVINLWLFQHRPEIPSIPHLH